MHACGIGVQVFTKSLKASPWVRNNIQITVLARRNTWEPVEGGVLGGHRSGPKQAGIGAPGLCLALLS